MFHCPFLQLSRKPPYLLILSLNILHQLFFFFSISTDTFLSFEGSFVEGSCCFEEAVTSHISLRILEFYVVFCSLFLSTRCLCFLSLLSSCLLFWSLSFALEALCAYLIVRLWELRPIGRQIHLLMGFPAGVCTGPIQVFSLWSEGPSWRRCSWLEGCGLAGEGMA